MVLDNVVPRSGTVRKGSLGKRVYIKPALDNAEVLKKRLGDFPLSGLARHGLELNLEQVGTIQREASQ